ncbi:MAG: HD domain-containing protein [Bulleidia sp.]|nr:HD domain-containing protein [Bulleidia sp.]
MSTENKYSKMVMDIVKTLEDTGRYSQAKDFMQHGKTSVYAHSIDVAITACKLAENYHFDVDYPSMIKGALLHDYFLYDWHVPHIEYGLHGFTHPYIAAQNAKDDYGLTPVEEDIIIHHMFPLTLYPPQSKEAWLVCWADKICAARESVVTRLAFFRKNLQREG